MLLKEKIYDLCSKFPHLKYVYPIYFFSLILATFLSQIDLVIENSPPFHIVIHPIILIILASIYSLFILFPLDNLIDRLEKFRQERLKSKYITSFLYIYLIYILLLFFFFLKTESFFIPMLLEPGILNPVFPWTIALFIPIIIFYIVLDTLIRRGASPIPEGTPPDLDKTKTSLASSEKHLNSISIKSDSLRFSFILFLVLVLGFSLFSVILVTSSTYRMNISNPWFRSDARIGLAFILLPTLLAVLGGIIVGLLGLIMTILLFIRTDRIRYFSRKYYAIPTVLSIFFLLLFLITPFAINLRSMEINRSYSQALNDNEFLISENSISLYNNSPQYLGEFRFDVDMTYMVILKIEKQPLPNREIELSFSFYNVSSEEYIDEPLISDGGISYNTIPSQIFIESTQIHLIGEPETYNYIITTIRVFFWKSNQREYNNLGVNCSVNLSDEFPVEENSSIFILFLKDPSAVIKRGYDELEVLNEFLDLYSFFILVPAILILLNSFPPLVILMRRK
ncbi:MAG: hypothetical protein EAX86_07320 [Candidatus Heimdallarchaeota archaeon]|nr:hypothetical protein [Candidatus Heimdallarchaeota archaeon]